MERAWMCVNSPSEDYGMIAWRNLLCNAKIFVRCYFHISNPSVCLDMNAPEDFSEITHEFCAKHVGVCWRATVFTWAWYNPSSSILSRFIVGRCFALVLGGGQRWWMPLNSRSVRRERWQSGLFGTVAQLACRWDGSSRRSVLWGNV